MAMLAPLLSACAARPEVIAAYRPLRKHPALFDHSEGWMQWIHPPLLEALKEYEEFPDNSTKLRSLLRVEVEGVHSFQFLSDEFCRLFLEELDHFYATGLPVDRPNSMNNYGIVRAVNVPWPLPLAHRCLPTRLTLDADPEAAGRRRCIHSILATADCQSHWPARCDHARPARGTAAHLPAAVPAPGGRSRRIRRASLLYGSVQGWPGFRSRHAHG